MSKIKISGGDWTTLGCAVLSAIIVARTALWALQAHTAVSLGLLS